MASFDFGFIFEKSGWGQTLYLGHIPVVGSQVPLTSGLQRFVISYSKFMQDAADLQKVVPAGKSQLRLVNLDNVQVGVSVVRPDPEVD